MNEDIFVKEKKCQTNEFAREIDRKHVVRMVVVMGRRVVAGLFGFRFLLLLLLFVLYGKRVRA